MGETLEDVTEEVGAAVNSDDVELTIELATTAVNDAGSATRAVSKQEVLDCLEQIKLAIIKSEAAFSQ